MEDNKNIEEIKDDSAVEDNTKNETVTTEKTFTQQEVDNLIQKRLDRALKKAQEEKEEAEKLAKMSEAERQKALFEKDIVKSEMKEILQILFEQKVDTTMTDIFYKNRKRVTKEEFTNVYNEYKSDGLFMVMQYLRFKFF